ncbi:MAG TPA: hypothetical protein VKT99_10490 [Xanthobacteraceae bacterium]|jgi:hypothetical protein|nr:hypothetical protein [Xanthobacteraceae bacterium]
MRKIWFGAASVALMVSAASAQDYHKNFAECAKEVGLFFDPSYTHKLQGETGGRVLQRWYFHSEAQAAVFNDCLARKASLATKPSAKGPQRVSR